MPYPKFLRALSTPFSALWKLMSTSESDQGLGTATETVFPKSQEKVPIWLRYSMTEGQLSAEVRNCLRDYRVVEARAIKDLAKSPFHECTMVKAVSKDGKCRAFLR